MAKLTTRKLPDSSRTAVQKIILGKLFYFKEKLLTFAALFEILHQ